MGIFVFFDYEKTLQDRLCIIQNPSLGICKNTKVDTKLSVRSRILQRSNLKFKIISKVAISYLPMFLPKCNLWKL